MLFMARKRKTAAPEGADPALLVSLDSALTLFRAEPSVSLAQIGQAAQLDPGQTAAFLGQYSSPADWLAVRLQSADPTAEFESALLAVQGDDAAEQFRDAMRRMIALTSRHRAYFELALIEAESYQGGTLSALSGRLLPAAHTLLQQIKAGDELRPLPDWLIARAMLAMLIGFIASERAMPASAQFAARLMPQRLWIDSLTDILLYGLIEDDARR